VRAMKELWTADEPEHHGRFFSFGPVKFEPKPVQKPHPPILFGGETEAALRRAAALGDGWYGVGHTPESAAKQVGRLRALRERAGRASEPFEVTVSASAAALDRAEIQRFAEAGVDRAVALPWARASEAEETLRRFAERVAA